MNSPLAIASEFEARFLARGMYDASEAICRHQALQSPTPQPNHQPAALGLVIGRISQRNRGNVFSATVKAYPQDTVIKFVPRNREAPVGGGQRDKVKGFSKSSRRRGIFRLRNVRPDVKWQSFITLTYPALFPNPEQAKRHLNIFLTSLRRSYPGIEYFWVVELQGRGALHYHIVTTKFIPKKWLSNRWFQVVGSGDEKHLKAGTSVQRVRNSAKLSSYLVGKYLNKTTQKTFEEWVGRVWGCSRGLEAQPEVTALQGTHQECSRALRPMVKLLRHRMKVNKYPWRWKGTSFSLYGVAPPQAEQLLSLGIAMLN